MKAVPEIFKQLGIDPENLPADAPKVPPQQVALFLRQIGTILSQAESYRSLPKEQQERILDNTKRIADVLDTSSPPAESQSAVASDPFAISF